METILQVKVRVPDSLMPDLQSGNANLMGLVKSADNRRIKKHLELVSWQEDKTATATQAGISLLVVGVITAVAFSGVKLFQFLSKKKIKDFEVALNNYVQAVNSQTLSESVIDELLIAMEKLLKKCRHSVILKLSTDEFIALINCLCDYTKDLASANSVDIDNEALDGADIFTKFKKNLTVQKSFFAQAA